MSRLVVGSEKMYSASSSNVSMTLQSLVYMPVPHPISFSRVDVLMSVSLATSATTNTAAIDLSAVGVIYSRNGSTLNPIVGQSSTTTYTWASSTGVFSSLTGNRLWSFNLATSLPAGDYWFGHQLITHSGSSIGASTTLLSGTFAPYYGNLNASLGISTGFAEMSVLTADTLNNPLVFQGLNSVSISNTTMTRQLSQMSHSSSAGLRANNIIVLRNV
jgi:hypothetical protein